MFSDIQQLQNLLVLSSLSKKAIKANSTKTATKESDVAAEDPLYPNDILAYVLSCSTDDDDNTVCSFVKPGDEIDLSSEY
jgi:hypothetical protein